MQNEKDLAWDRYSEEYVIQALANLGQRIGIKGDGISYKSFTFNDILTSHESFSSTDYIGYVEYINSTDNVDERVLSRYKANFGITKKSDLNDIINIDTSISINDVLYFPNELSFTIPINGVEKYSKNSICINNGTEFTYILVGKFIGYEDTDNDNAVLLYYKFDIATNKLKYLAKIYKFNEEENGSKYYNLITVKNNDYDKKKLSNDYTMTINILNTKNISSEYSLLKNEFEKIFKYSNYNDPSKIPFNILNSDFINLDNLELYNDNININYEANSPVAIMLNTDKFCKDNGYPSYNINLTFDSDASQLLSQNITEFNSIIELYANEYKLNLDEEIYFINENINKLYYNIFQYYNEKFYLDDRVAFVKRILSKIYEKASDYTYGNATRLYIPLDYEFHYICNSNNEMQIYYSNNIYVTYVDIDKLDLEEFWESNTNLIYDYKKVNKVKVYNFEINYNKNKDTLINSVVIKDIYTMPYVNANNNWSINDTDTKIQAIGKDAGNPNIIIIYNNDKNNLSDSYKILNAISNKKYIIGAEYEQKWFNVNNALFENIFDVDIRCCAYIPKITNINFEYFKNSIILGISDLNCLYDSDYRYNYKGTYILTLWNLVEVKDNEYEFQCITHSNTNYALALGSSVNLLNETDDSSVGNLNDQDLILLKSIINTVAQERLAVSNNNWLILKNKQAEEYPVNVNEIYKNDLNAIIQYNDKVELKSNHIIHSQANKYINDISNLSTTNSLYPRYVTKTTQLAKNEAIIKLQKINSPSIINKVRETRVIVNDTRVTNIESLIEELGTGLVEINDIKKIVVEESVLQPTKYNEYVFNSNIPTIDFKEIFNRNINVLNRVNVISLDHSGNAYNAYIGTSYDESGKNVLHIGTTSTNINIGTDTLLSEIEKTKFKTHDTLSLDFNNIKVNAKTPIFAKTPILSQWQNNNITYNLLTYELIGSCGSDIVSSLLGQWIDSANPQKITSWNNDTAHIFAKHIIDTSHNQYYLLLNNVMYQIFGINLKEYLNKTHIYYNGINYGNYINSNNKYKSEDLSFISINRSSLTDRVHIIRIDDIDIYELPNNSIYCAAKLNIMYYILDGNIHIYISLNK